jgi:hypothetical protein
MKISRKENIMVPVFIEAETEKDAKAALQEIMDMIGVSTGGGTYSAKTGTPRRMKEEPNGKA